MKAVKILVSHTWEKEDGHAKSVYEDKNWKNIRGIIKPVVDEVEKGINGISEKNNCRIDVKRLRGQHGQFLLIAL